MMKSGLFTLLFSALILGIFFFGDISWSEEDFDDFLVSSEVLEYPLLQKVFPGVTFFVETSKITMPPSQRIVAKLDDKTYLMAMEFNVLFKQIEKISTASLEERLESFAWLSYWLTDDGLKVNSVKLVTRTIRKKRFNYEIDILVNGVEGEIFIWYEDVQVKWAEAYREGSRQSIIAPASRADELKDVEISIAGVTPVTYSGVEHYYVPVSENGTATGKSITFNITGLRPNQENVHLWIEPDYGYADSLFLNRTLTVDPSGNASYTWTPANNDTTGICWVAVDSGGIFPIYLDDARVIPEHMITGIFPSGYAYTIYYANQFFFEHDFLDAHPLGHTHAPTFAGYVDSALVASWVKQVNEWSLAQGLTNHQPEDADNNYMVCVNDHVKDHRYHGTYTNHAFGGSNRKIGIRYDSYMTQPLYSSELMRIKVAMCHEFYHGIQWGHNEWDSGDWLVEGQARALPSVQYESEEYLETTQHLYPVDANSYLRDWLNRSLTVNYGTAQNPVTMSYRYCLYWRLLYEYYTFGTIGDRLEIFRESCKSCNVETPPAIENGMTSALASCGGVYDTFDESVEDLAKWAYLNDPDHCFWQPCPDAGFYITPDITNDPDENGITNTFRGERIIEDDDIPVSFGIDYMVFDFDVKKKWVLLEFEGDPDRDNDMADFFVKVLLLNGNELISEPVLQLNDTAPVKGKGGLSFEVDNPVDKAVVVIARLDSLEGGCETDYRVTVSQAKTQATLTKGPYKGLGDIRLDWFGPDSTLGVRYVIYRSTAPYVLGDSIAGTRDTTYIDLGAAGDKDINYCYSITAKDSAGHESEPINQVGEWDEYLAAVTPEADDYFLTSWPFIVHNDSIQAVFADSMTHGCQLTGGFPAINSDMVQYFDEVTNSYYSAWYKVGGPGPSNVWRGSLTTVEPDKGYWIVIREGHPSIVLTMTGEVSDTNRNVHIDPEVDRSAFNFVGSCYALQRDIAGVTEDDCNLIGSGFTGGFPATNSDIIRHFDGATWYTAWYKIGGPGPNDVWKGLLDSTQTANEPHFNPGKGYIIEVRAERNFYGDTWDYPVPSVGLKGEQVAPRRNNRTAEKREVLPQVPRARGPSTNRSLDTKRAMQDKKRR